MLKGGPVERNKALRLVYVQNRDRICKFIIANSGTAVESQDVFQESVIAFYENVKRNRYKGDSAISTYIYSIARFKWYNQIKKNDVRSHHYKKLEVPAEFSESAMSVLIDDESKNQVLQLLGLLGEDCRNILVESIYHGSSMRAIAESGYYSSEQIVRNKKYKCIKKLRELLATRPELLKILKSDE